MLSRPPRPRRHLALMDVASIVVLPAILLAGLATWSLADDAANGASHGAAAPPAAAGGGDHGHAERGDAHGDTAVRHDDAARFSYGVGFDLGEKVRNGLHADGQSAELDLVVLGFEHGLKGADPAVPRDELARVLRAVHERLLQKAATQRYADDPDFRKLADENAARSQDAMRVFASERPATTFEEGILTRVLASGPESTAPVGDDLAVVTFRIFGCDARKIDDRTEVTLDPGFLMPAAGRVLRTMRPGDHWLVAFAPDKAFGLGGEPPDIGPNEALIVDVTVVGTAPRGGAGAAGGAPGADHGGGR